MLFALAQRHARRLSRPRRKMISSAPLKRLQGRLNFRKARTSFPCAVVDKRDRD